MLRDPLRQQRRAPRAYTMHSAFLRVTCCIRDKPRALRAPCAVALRVPPPAVRSRRSQTSTRTSNRASMRVCVGEKERRTSQGPPQAGVAHP